MRLFGWLFGYGGNRSPKWSSVRREHLRKEPLCIACGRANDLEVHHLRPFHDAPELELDPANLATCCRECHYSLAHAYDWKAWRPEFRKLAEIVRKAEVCR